MCSHNFTSKDTATIPMFIFIAYGSRIAQLCPNTSWCLLIISALEKIRLAGIGSIFAA